MKDIETLQEAINMKAQSVLLKDIRDCSEKIRIALIQLTGKNFEWLNISWISGCNSLSMKELMDDEVVREHPNAGHSDFLLIYRVLRMLMNNEDTHDYPAELFDARKKQICDEILKAYEHLKVIEYKLTEDE